MSEIRNWKIEIRKSKPEIRKSACHSERRLHYPSACHRGSKGAFGTEIFKGAKNLHSSLLAVQEELQGFFASLKMRRRFSNFGFPIWPFPFEPDSLRF